MKKIIFILIVAICTTTATAQTLSQLLKIAECTDSTQALNLLAQYGFTFDSKENYFVKSSKNLCSDTTGWWSHNIISFSMETYKGEVITGVTFTSVCEKEIKINSSEMKTKEFEQTSGFSIYKSESIPGLCITIETGLFAENPAVTLVTMAKRNVITTN